MFRPHNRILLRGQASRIEKKKKRKGKEKEKKRRGRRREEGGEKKRKREECSWRTPWMLAILRKGTKIKQASPDFTIFSRPREILRATSLPRLLLHGQPSLRAPSFSFILRVRFSSFSVPRRGLTKLRINVNFLTEWRDLCSFNRAVAYVLASLTVRYW